MPKIITTKVPQPPTSVFTLSPADALTPSLPVRPPSILLRPIGPRRKIVGSRKVVEITPGKTLPDIGSGHD